MITEEIILNWLNDMDYKINIFYIRDLLKKYVKDGVELREQLMQIMQVLGIQEEVDLNSNKAMLDIINSKFSLKNKISSLNKKVLEELFDYTNNEIFSILMQYRSISDKYTKAVSFIKSSCNADFDKDNKKIIQEFMSNKLNEVDRKNFKRRVKFNQKIKNGAVIVSNPSIPFGIEDIKEIFGFNFVFRGDNLQDCLDLLEVLLKKYQPLMGDDEGGYFIILRSTLFIKVLKNEREIMPFMYSVEEEEEIRKLIKQFRKEFIEVRHENTESAIIDDISGDLHLTVGSALIAEYNSEFGRIKIDYDNIKVIENEINLLELIQRSGDTENIKKNINSIFESITPKIGRMERLRIDLDRKGIISASADVIVGTKSYILSLKNGEFEIKGDILF